MIASFHIVEYRKREFAPSKRLAEQVEGLRFWRPLNIGGDFGFFREHPSRWGLYRRLRPDFRSWAFYAVWEDDAALDEFLATSDTGRAWSEGAVETCHLRLHPKRVRGPWEGMQVLRGSETPGHVGDTVVYIVRLDLSARGALAMWGFAAPAIFHHLADGNEMLLGLPLVDRPYVQPVSFTVWRSETSAATFIRSPDGHRAAVRRLRRSQSDFMDRHSSGRFEPYRCEGTWKGRDAASLTSTFA